MTKTSKTSKASNASSRKASSQNLSAPDLVVLDKKTGKSVVVKGYAALKDSDFKIKKGVDLARPIARQILARPVKKRSAG